ncbi:MAG TPA: glucosidase, partial [Acetobacteraceae bacterium]|nr:glucosidase [Acetobacteraceae bacterium]
MTTERDRLEAQHQGRENWRLWGPYLAERAWGTVREDYSPGGTAWEYFDHDQARSRAYRWNEDGMGGICDSEQRLCLAMAIWNGVDPILKERAFGLTGNQGNHGEDVKEYYFYLDATPSHSYLRYLYKYPQRAYPYAQLVEENGRRSRSEPAFNLADTGVFDENRYWDVEVAYAKASPEEIHVAITATNRSPDAATLEILPTLWFRNDWNWGGNAEKPQIRATLPPRGARWSLRAEHATLGAYYLYGKQAADVLLTENETNASRLWGAPNASPFVKDAFHRYVIDGDLAAVNPDGIGTKAAARHTLAVAAGESATINLVLSAAQLTAPFGQQNPVFAQRRAEAMAFYDELLPDAAPRDRAILRQSLAGMIWSKQFFHYDVARWLDGDALQPPDSRKTGRNGAWRHLKASDVISMPDTWEYPWFAAWDLAFHCAALALVDIDFAKDQIELLLRDTYFHPKGQIPAYEWAFSDVNPPVIAWAALKVFRAERVQRGQADTRFLQRVVHKLLMNLTWWLNQKDRGGKSVFEGGFLGLDNISVYDRSQPLPDGYRIEQADATGWMAVFALNLTVICLELTAEDHDYEGIAIQCYKQFLAIANAVGGHMGQGVSLWDEQDGFFKDLIVGPDGRPQRIDVFSFVGIIPMFASEVVDRRLLMNAPRFVQVMDAHAGGLFDGHKICACPARVNARGERLLSLVDDMMLPRMLRRILNEDEFLSNFGIRAVSKLHAEKRDLGDIQGIGRAMIEYVPGESNSGLFGGNSNWRGPIWMPTNFMLLQAIEKFHRFLGDDYMVSAPSLSDEPISLEEVSRRLSQRLVDMFRPDEQGRTPALAGIPLASSD